MVKTGSNMPIASNATMPSYAFYYCQALSSIDWLSSCYQGLVSIPSYAFYYCKGIKSLSSLPSRIIALGSYAFKNCTAAQASALTLPSSLTSVGSYAYQGCYNLRTLDIPSSLTVLNDYAFAGCYGLSSIVDRRLTA